MAIVGSRRWPPARRALVEHAVYRIAEQDPRAIIVTGDAQGADRFARDAALEAGLVAVVCCAPWDALGWPAGPRRNQVVADLAASACQTMGELRERMGLKFGHEKMQMLLYLPPPSMEKKPLALPPMRS